MINSDLSVNIIFVQQSMANEHQRALMQNTIY